MFFKKKQETKESASQKNWDVFYKAFLKSDFRKAFTALNSLKDSEPNNPQLHIKLGDLLQRMADTKKAIEEYHRAASLFVGEGFRTKALAIYKIILRLEPGNEDAVGRTKAIIEEIEGASAPSAALPSAPEPAFEGFPQDAAAAAAWGAPDESKAAAGWPPAGEAAGQAAAGWPEDEKTEAAPEPSAPMEEQWPGLDISEIAGAQEATVVPELFSSMSREAAEALLGRAVGRTYEDGRKVVEEGDSGDSMFIIKSGRADVVLHIMDKTIRLATLSEGDVFGEVAFLTGRPRTATVIADGALEVLEVDRLLLQEAIEGDPVVMQKLMGFYHSRVSDTIRKVKEN